MDEQTNNTPGGELPQETPAVAPKKTKNKSKIVNTKPRSVEELESVSPDKMTPKELVATVKYLREMTNQLGQQAAAYEGNARSAYEQARDLQVKYDDLRVRTNSTLAFIKQATAICNTTIALAANKLEG